MHIQYSYNSNVSILLVSLLSHASGSLRTTPFHFLRNVFTLVPLALTSFGLGDLGILVRCGQASRWDYTQLGGY